MERVITNKSGESFPHRALWRCATVQLEQANILEKGRFYFDLSAVLMAYLAYEAYINFVGDRLDPETWKREKVYFNQPEYYGIEGKLKRIRELCGGFEIDSGRRPYQTVIELGRFRSSVVHAKTDRYKKTIEEHAKHEPDWWPESAFSSLNAKKAQRAIDDIELFIEHLHSQIKPFIADVWFGDKALRGPTGYATSSTRLKS